MKRTRHAFPGTAKDGRPILVRESRPSDARACLKITIGVAAERPRTLAVTEGEMWSPKQWREHRIPWCQAGVSLVAELAGDVVGSLGIMRGTRRATQHSAEFGIYLAPHARGLGIGRALIDCAETWAREFGVSRIALGVFSTNDRAVKLYEACGYQHEGVERNGMQLPEGPVDVITMAKLL